MPSQGSDPGAITVYEKPSLFYSVVDSLLCSASSKETINEADSHEKRH
jgi:hypothetical protein